MAGRRRSRKRVEIREIEITGHETKLPTRAAKITALVIPARVLDLKFSKHSDWDNPTIHVSGLDANGKPVEEDLVMTPFTQLLAKILVTIHKPKRKKRKKK